MKDQIIKRLQDEGVCEVIASARAPGVAEDS